MIEPMFDDLWESLQPVGLDLDRGGYHRLIATRADLECREWFYATAQALDMIVETDENTNLWAWWTEDQPPGQGVQGVLALGSHLDSVRGGGAYDGPLGIVSAFAAIHDLQQSGARPRRPVAVIAFAEEEGGRFGVACAGSRLMSGQIDPEHARSLVDEAGMTLEEVLAAIGHTPERLGPEPWRVAALAAFVELHIEQGRGLVDIGAPLGIAEGIWPHGRYLLEFAGEGNHAGTTRMEHRRDPMRAFAQTTAAAIEKVQGDARVTFGRIEVRPNSTNSIASRVQASMDVRARAPDEIHAFVQWVEEEAARNAHAAGSDFRLHTASFTQAVVFDRDLSHTIQATLEEFVVEGQVPILETAAGHDAGVLATAGVPTAMIFVRNPSGISHAPSEYASRDDCILGARALRQVLLRHLEPGEGLTAQRRPQRPS